MPPATTVQLDLCETLALAQRYVSAGQIAAASSIYRQMLAAGFDFPASLKTILDMAAEVPDDPALPTLFDQYLSPVTTIIQDGFRITVNSALLNWARENLVHEAPDLHSQSGQDLAVLRHYFDDPHGRTFVDIGAYNGITGSNTWLLERAYGWRGLCIEPDPQQFALLVQNRTSTSIQAGIAEIDGSAEFIQVLEGFKMMGGLAASYEPETLAKVQESSPTAVITVPTRRLDNLLAEHGLTTIDYLSIDVEGGELGVLQGIDFSRVSIGMMSVENNTGAPDVREFLKNAGFRMSARYGMDDLFVSGER